MAASMDGLPILILLSAQYCCSVVSYHTKHEVGKGMVGTQGSKRNASSYGEYELHLALVRDSTLQDKQFKQSLRFVLFRFILSKRQFNMQHFRLTSFFSFRCSQLSIRHQHVCLFSFSVAWVHATSAGLSDSTIILL